MSQSVTSPKTEPAAAVYAARRSASRGKADRLHRRHLLLGYVTLAWIVLLLGLGWFAYGPHAVGAWWLLVPVVGFALTNRAHDRVQMEATRSRRAVLHFDHGLARLEDRWAGVHPRPFAPDTSGSLYAADLDLFGPGSLFELLCDARTSLGEQMLAGWLLGPAEAGEIAARQSAVAVLRDRVALRETLAATPGPDRIQIDRDGLSRWGQEAQPGVPFALAVLAPVLALLTVAAAGYWAWSRRPEFLVLLLVTNGSLTFFLQRRIRPLFAQAERAARRLGLLAALCAPLEREHFAAPRLNALQAQLREGREPASAAIRRLAWLAAAIEYRSNGFVRILDALLLYSVQLSVFVQRWHKRNGARLGDWLEATGEFEALLSLSAFHFEHPDDPFPEILPGIPGGDEAASGPVWAAEALGHPLLPAAACVRNDVALGRDTRLLLVSGSNMSGKSTLLRSVGVATVMAMAGAPVRARRLRLTPVHLGASIQVNDSLASGRSRFYAEILRLRSIRDLARAHPPVLFLLDELLAGTNSHDRLAGATGLVRELLDAGALGLLSTHDLALAEVSELSKANIRNAHFEDTVRGDKIDFDYTLREGVVTRSNGIALMRLIGLDV